MTELLNDFMEIDSDGRVALRLGLIFTVYFTQGHSRKMREAVLECLNEYNQLCGDHLNWWVVEGSRFSPVASLVDRDMSPYLLSDRIDSDPEQAWAVFWHGGEHSDDASNFRFDAFGTSMAESEFEDALSYVSATLPLTWIPGRSGEALDLYFRWCERLQPLHGYGGAGIVVAASDGLAVINEIRVYALAKRHPGLEVDYPEEHALWTEEAIKGGNWITVLADAFVDRLGGKNMLLETLGKGFKVRDFHGGVMIIAGDAPEIGDRNRNKDTPRYRELARVLKPVRVTMHPAVHQTAGGFDREEFEAWLARFDEQ